MKKTIHKIVIKDGESTRTYRQSNMCRRLFGWYAPEALTKAEASALIERGLMSQKDDSFKIVLSIEEKNRLGGMGNVYLKAWLESGCTVWGRKPKLKPKATPKAEIAKKTAERFNKPEIERPLASTTK